MLRKSFFCLLGIILAFAFHAQTLQELRGTVNDEASGIGLPGVLILMETAGTKLQAVSNENGYYVLKAVPLGRHNITFQYPGYYNQTASQIAFSSGKPTELNINLKERTIQMEEVKVESRSELSDRLAELNSKSFRLEETERYAASRQDPARMVQSFAGIQGTNDSRNDIVVRGNSPAGVLYRMDDMDIPNPNHFAVAGTSGGPQSILNNKYLSNSAFYNGAFPAEFGNAMGGVFDLRFRNGSAERHERSFQFGFLGTELALEGPLNKKGASYLATYRYSSLALFSQLKIPIGTSAVPYYQDFGFRISIPTAKAGHFSFSAIGGASSIELIFDTMNLPPKELYGDLNRNQYFNTQMGVGIIGHVLNLGPKTLMKTNLAVAAQGVDAYHQLIIRDSTFKPLRPCPDIMGFRFEDLKSSLSWYIRHKFNSRHSIRSGFYVHRTDVNYKDSVKRFTVFDTSIRELSARPFNYRLRTQSHFYTLQPYATYQWQLTEVWQFQAGLHGIFSNLNSQSQALEPRLQIRFQPHPRQQLGFSYGMHSQFQSLYLYYTVPDSGLNANNTRYANTNLERLNKNMGLSRAHHFVASYVVQLNAEWTLRTEMYYQKLFNIPVYQVPSAVSSINRGATFSRFFPIYNMQNTGTGQNLGAELTLEKRFSKNYFAMANITLYDSKYTASNGQTYDTDFNGRFSTNWLAGYELPLNSKNDRILGISTKYTVAGGKRYTDSLNLSASNAQMDIVPMDAYINNKQFPNYQRLDVRVTFKWNNSKYGTEIALDLINVLNTKNILALSYSPNYKNLNSLTPYTENYQLGFLPLFYIKVDF